MSGAFFNILILDLEYLISRMRFIIFVSELKVVLQCNSANASFVVESMSRQRMVESSQLMVVSVPWMSMTRDLIKLRPLIISQRSMLRSTTCSD